jgi:hypothetical protein
MKSLMKTILAALLLIFPGSIQVKSQTQQSPTNSNEDSVKPYTLPDPLLLPEKPAVKTSQDWTRLQRPYIYTLFQQHVYGRFPRRKIPFTHTTTEPGGLSLNGMAKRKQVRISLKPGNDSVYIDLLIYLPSSAQGKVPVFLGYNFNGNHTIHHDTAIKLSKAWIGPRGRGVVNNRATEASRGSDTASWPVTEILKHGYGVVTAYYGDLEADHPEGWKSGIRTTLSKELAIRPDEWGAIGAWAWGLALILDYLEEDPLIDAKRVAVFGHSRLGKAALWAAASDERFAMVISNESGEGGAALSKRNYGETVKVINEKFPHWFGLRYKTYGEHTAALPVDQHMLLALMAPRPLYVASAEGDQWSDPKGEFLSAMHAGKVYALFNKKGVGTETMPGLHQPVGEFIRYHNRAGRHDITRYDWQQYLQFADMHWKR